MQGDVFGLNRLYELQVKNKEGTQTIQSSDLKYGYFGGGSFVDLYHRLDYATELTTIISGNPVGAATISDGNPTKRLVIARGNLTSAYTGNYGYTFAGIIGPPTPVVYTNTIERFEFSTETNNLIGARTTEQKGQGATVFNSNYAYTCGGASPIVTSCIVDRLDFGTETISSPGKNIPTSKYAFSGVPSPSTNYGYLGAGIFPTDVCTITRLDFTTETVSNSGKSMAPARWGSGSTFNSEYGYWGGGYFNAPPTFVQVFYSTVSRIEFGTETVTNLPSGLSQARFRVTGNSGPEAGYYIAGQNSTSTNTCRIDRLNFTTETISNTVNTYHQYSISGMFSYASSKNFKRTRNYFNENSLYGYFGGGDVPTRTTNIDRLDYSNETVSSPGKYLPAAREAYGAFASPSYGYYGGGRSSPNTLPASVLIHSAIDRIDFISETLSIVSSSTTRFKSGHSGTQSNNYGYFGGGYAPATPTPVSYSTLERFDFSTETVSLPTRHITQPRYNLASIESENYGYYSGGRLPSATFTNTSTIDRVDFSTETISIPGRNMLGLRSAHAGASSNTYGYFGGGYSVVSPATRTCTIERMDFLTETIDLLGGSFATANSFSASSNSLSYGYFGGGGTPLATSVSSFQRLDFYTNITSTPTGNLSTTRRIFDGLSGGINKARRNPIEITTQYGYFGGGYNVTAPIRRSVISRLDLTTEVSTTIPQTLTSDRSNMAGAPGTTYGYYMGGFNPTPAQVCTIDRLDFSSEVVSSAASQLLTARGGNISLTSPASDRVYTTGGNNPTPTNICTIERFDLTTEVSTNIPAVTSLTGQYASAIDGIFGGIFFGGQITPTTFSCRIERISYASETISTYTAGMPAERYNSATTGNAMFGFVGGGNVPVAAITNVINRVDLITDTTITSPANTLQQTRRGNIGVSNWAFGYYAGGSTPPNIYLSNIDRLDFTTETSRLSSYFMSSSLEFPTGLAAKPKIIKGSSFTLSTYGYFAGGTTDPTGAFSCTVDRIDFSNETMSVGSALPQVRDRASTVSSPSYGYYAGGRNAPTTHVSTITRFDYASSVYALPGRNLTLGRSNLGSAENVNYGYFGGGYMQTAPFSRCLIDRLDFSNETVQAPTVVPGQLFLGVNSLTAVSSKNYGYFAGGTSPLNSGPLAPGDRVTTVNRLDFSTEVTSLPGNNMNDVGTLGKQGFCATQTINYGYFAGGVNPGGGTQVTVSTFNRLDFSTETLSVPSKFLTLQKSSFDAVSASSYGYYGAGSATTRTCVIDRIDFATETVVSPGSYFISVAKSAISGLQNG